MPNNPLGYLWGWKCAAPGSRVMDEGSRILGSDSHVGALVQMIFCPYWTCENATRTIIMTDTREPPNLQPSFHFRDPYPKESGDVMDSSDDDEDSVGTPVHESTRLPDQSTADFQQSEDDDSSFHLFYQDGETTLPKTSSKLESDMDFEQSDDNLDDFSAEQINQVSGTNNDTDVVNSLPIVFSNPPPTIHCYFNAAMVCILHLVSLLGIAAPEERMDMDQEHVTFIDMVSEWISCKKSKVVNPRPALFLFVAEFLGGNKSFVCEQQEAECLFEATVSDETLGREGCRFFSFMQPTTAVQTIIDACCQGISEEWGQIAPNPVLILPFPTNSAQTLEDLIIQYFTIPEFDRAMCNKCKKKQLITRFNRLINSKRALVVSLTRATGGYNRARAAKKNKRIKLGKNVSLKTSNNEAVTYKLIGIIQHIGASINSGHYVSHLLETDNEWRRYDDDRARRKSRINELENGQIFLFKKE